MLNRYNPTPYTYETIYDAYKRTREKIRFCRPSIRKHPTLKWQGGADYKFRKGEDTAWIEIEGYSAYVRRTQNGGIAVEIINHTKHGTLETVARCGISAPDPSPRKPYAENLVI